MVTAAPGIALIVVGIVLAVVGGIAYSTCSSVPTVGSATPSCGGFGAIVGLGILLLIVGAIVAAIGAGARTTRIQQVPDPSVPPPIIQPVVINQTVERDTVKVRCRYCGNLYDVTATHCPACGAPVG
jgi:hypothetical protein